jgi:hypothetical protein
MKHLKLFNDAASYEAWKNSENYILPNVIFSEETGVVYEAVKETVKTVFYIDNPEDIKELYLYLEKCTLDSSISKEYDEYGQEFMMLPVDITVLNPVNGEYVILYTDYPSFHVVRVKRNEDSSIQYFNPIFRFESLYDYGCIDFLCRKYGEDDYRFYYDD